VVGAASSGPSERRRGGTVTVVEPDRAAAELLARALGEPGRPPVDIVARVDDLAWSEQVPDVVVLGPGVVFTRAADVALQRRALDPRNGTVLVRRTADPLLLLEAERAGVAAVVSEGDDRRLVAAVDRALERAGRVGPSPGSPPGLQVVVFSAKGGVGTSQVAVNLAASLATQAGRTCLVDLDVHAGDIGQMLGIAPARPPGPLEDALGSLVTRHSDNLDVVAAPAIGSATVCSGDVGYLLDVLAERYDAVVVDTSGAFDGPAVQALDRCDVAALVGTVDVLCLASLERTAGTLDLLGVPRDRWRLVLNRVSGSTERDLRSFQRELGLPAAAIVPESRAVRAAVGHGEPVVRRAPRDSAARAFRDLATGLLPSPTQPSAHLSRVR
jgi:pilus assembly protein CpaE